MEWRCDNHLIPDYDDPEEREKFTELKKKYMESLSLHVKTYNAYMEKYEIIERKKEEEDKLCREFRNKVNEIVERAKEFKCKIDAMEKFIHSFIVGVTNEYFSCEMGKRELETIAATVNKEYRKYIDSQDDVSFSYECDMDKIKKKNITKNINHDFDIFFK